MATTKSPRTASQKKSAATELLRQRKIESCKKKISLAEETIAAMEAKDADTASNFLQYRDLSKQIDLAKQEICTAKRSIQILEKK